MTTAPFSMPPRRSNGYVLFTHDDYFRGHYIKLCKLREFCIESDLSPDAVKVYRSYAPDPNKDNRELMLLDEYAYPFEQRLWMGGPGGGLTVQNGWQWTEFCHDIDDMNENDNQLNLWQAIQYAAHEIYDDFRQLIQLL